MAIPRFTQKRLFNDYTELLNSPVDYVWAHPLHDNILEWHYVLRGPADCPFYDGIYHGKLLFPKDYPLNPPAIYMLTPTGKFQCNVRLCLWGISDYYPEAWSPACPVFSILIGLLSFMTDPNCGPFVGMDVQPIYKQKQSAQDSWTHNLNNETFCKYFPNLVHEAKQRLL